MGNQLSSLFLKMYKFIFIVAFCNVFMRALAKSDKTEEKKSIDDFMLKRNDIDDFMLKRNGDEIDDFMLKRNDISDFMMRRGDVSDFMLKRNDIDDFMMKKRAGDISDFMMKRFFPTPMVGAGL